MKPPIPDVDRKLAQKAYDQACKLIEGELILHENQGRKPPGFWTRIKLKRAAKLFERVLSLVPDNWNSMWLLGKILQRLGREKDAFDWMVKAWDEQPRNANVAREAALMAMRLGLSRHAIEYCEEAMKIEPNNPGLVCNLALAFVHDGKLEQAYETAARAAAMDDKDKVTQNVLRVIQHIKTSKAPCPKNSAELDAYCKKHRGIFR